MRRDVATTEHMQIDQNMSLADYFGQHYVYEEVKNNSIFQAFNAKSKKINAICKNLGLDIGMAQVMYGRFWVNLKFYEFDHVQDWIVNNHRRRYQIFYPELHKVILTTNGKGHQNYKNWFERGVEE